MELLSAISYFYAPLLVEFFIQAIPCYFFLISFLFRYYVIRQLGYPRPISFTWLQLIKILATSLNILIRAIQIISAFHFQKFWLFAQDRSLYSLFYLQFMVAHSLSLYLLFYQHMKRLPEVKYCHQLFWFLSIPFSLVFLETSMDGFSLFFNIAVLSTNAVLFGAMFFKQRTIKKVNWYQRPLLANDSGLFQTVPILEKLRTINHSPKDWISFKFNSKIESFERQCVFEFRVTLPENIIGHQEPTYVLKKSLEDFYNLSQYVEGKYDVPELDGSIFESRMKDQKAMMSRRVKTLSNYLTVLGKNQQVQKDQYFLEFIEVHDKFVIRRLRRRSLQEHQEGVSQSSDFQSMLFDKKYTVIDNYEISSRKDSISRSFSAVKSTQSILTVAEVQNIFELTVLPSSQDCLGKMTIQVVQKQNDYSFSPSSFGNVVRRISLNANSSQQFQVWDVEKSQRELSCLLEQNEVDCLEKLNSEIAKKGANILTLFFIEYFRMKDINYKEYALKLLSYRKFSLIQLSIDKQNIVIENLESTQLVDLTVKLLIQEFGRVESLSLQKSYKQLKSFCRLLEVMNNLKSDKVIFQKEQSFFYSDHQLLELKVFLEKAFSDTNVLTSSTAIEFLSDIVEPRFKEKGKTPLQSLIISSLNGSVFNQKESLNLQKNLDDTINEEECSFELRIQSPTFPFRKALA